MLVLDKSICWSKSTFNDVTQWNDWKSWLKCYCSNYHVETKSCERNNKHKNDNNEQSSEHKETDEDDDSDQETDSDSVFSFHRIVPDEVPLKKRNIP